jgi:hypothetical protein
MPFCSNCGSQLNPAARFCHSCGTATQTANTQAQPPATSVPSAAPNKVLTMLPQAKKMKALGLFDSYTIVFTADQAIFAKLSGDVLKDVVKKSQEQSKAEGKGMFAKVGAQMKAFYNAHLRYLDMIPEQILAEDKSNFALPHASVSALKVKRRMEYGGEDGPGSPYLELEWEATSGKYKYRVDMEPEDTLELLNQFYAGKIRI